MELDGIVRRAETRIGKYCGYAVVTMVVVLLMLLVAGAGFSHGEDNLIFIKMIFHAIFG